jgi:hypothetical protein
MLRSPNLRNPIAGELEHPNRAREGGEQRGTSDRGAEVEH